MRSLPPRALKQIDQAAEQAGESRSGFIARICVLAAAAKSDREVRRRINKLQIWEGVRLVLEPDLLLAG